jgi:hypothetical protein
MASMIMVPRRAVCHRVLNLLAQVGCSLPASTLPILAEPGAIVYSVNSSQPFGLVLAQNVQRTSRTQQGFPSLSYHRLTKPASCWAALY